MPIKLETTKKIVKFVVGMSTAFTVGNVIGNNVNPDNKFRKAECVVGGAVVGSMVADAAEEHIDRKIDEIVGYFRGEKDEAKLNIVV